MRDEDERRARRKAAGVDVAHQVVLKNGQPVVHVRPGLAVGEAVEEAAKAQALRLFALLAGRVLEVAKVLLAQLHLLLRAHDGAPREGAAHGGARLAGALVGGHVKMQRVRRAVGVKQRTHGAAGGARLLHAAWRQRDGGVGDDCVPVGVYIALRLCRGGGFG